LLTGTTANLAFTGLDERVIRPQIDEALEQGYLTE
jgi:hypothetical protein